jgi:hypothetical protein
MTRLAFMMGLLDDFAMEFGDVGTQPFEGGLAVRGEDILAAALGLNLGGEGTEPASLDHPGEERVKGARAQRVTVAAQLIENALAVYRPLRCVVQYVDLPKGEKDLPRNSPIVTHSVSIIVYDNR